MIKNHTKKCLLTNSYCLFLYRFLTQKHNQMKLLKAIIFSFLLAGISPQTHAQFFKKIANHAKEKVKREAERRTERRVDKGIDKTFDKAEGEIDGKNKSGKKNKKTKKKNQSNQTANTQKNTIKKTTANPQPKLVWSRYDFVPGDTVIFEDGPADDEEVGEFPSRWDLKEGNAEIAEVDGNMVIVFPHGGEIVPYLKNSKEDYLPEVYTIEFDAYYQPEDPRRVWISFYDSKNQKRIGQDITFYYYGIRYKDSGSDYKPDKPKGGWRHFAIAVTKDKLKAYMDDQRLVNIPHIGFNPTGVTLEVDGYAADKVFGYIKNFRIAKGGVKYYKRVITDGKIIVNGIKFDVNKATLKPESMGPINRIYRLMKKQPDLKFSVEGHTDSDGDEAFNLKLSKERAKTVINKLISMGIDKSRLKYTGWGESKPIDNNNTPEGKANNRRVEFVKF